MNPYSHCRRIFSFVLACVILFSCSPKMAGQRVMTQKIDDIYFPDTQYMSPAWFSHEKHIFAGVHCRDCHNKLFPSKKGATDVTVQVVEGKAADNIIAAAAKENADLIVMGRRGLGDVAGLLMGSVSHKVTHLSDCACLTVK